MHMHIEKFSEYLINERARAKNTVLSYRQDLKKFYEFLEKEGIPLLKPEKINQTNIMAYLLHLEMKGNTTSTICRKLATLKTYFKFLVNYNFVASDPSYKIKAPKSERRLPPATDPKNISLLLAQPNRATKKGNRDAAILELLFGTGIRVSELINLNMTDVHLNMKYITCGGKSKKRVLPLKVDTIETLRFYLNKSRGQMLKNTEETAFFVNCGGRRFTRQGLWKIIKSYAEKADIHESITPNILRHSFAMQLVSDGTDMEALQELLGHADTTATQVYFRKRD